MTVEIRVEGLEPILARFTKFKSVMNRELRKTMDLSLNIIHESIPAYPPKKPTTKYIRTGILGKSLGVNQGGSPSGKPDIRRITGSGNYIQGEFGSRLYYAPYVIGEKQARQNKHWWIFARDVPTRAMGKLTDAWNNLANNLAAFLDGKGL